MISAKIFLKVLAKKDLIPSDAIRKLKRQIEESPTPIPAEAVAKRLVKKGYLTAPLAQRLLKTAAEAERMLNEQAEQTIVDEPSKSAGVDGSNLGFAVAPAQAEDEDTVIEDVVESESEPIPPSAELKIEPEPLDAAGLADDGIFEGEVVVDDVVEGEIVLGTTTASVDLDREATDKHAQRGKHLAAKRKGLSGMVDKITPKRDRKRKENPWDSTLMLIGGGGLLIILISGGLLAWLLFGQGGDQMLEEANKLYREAAYTKAIDQYDKFLEKYPGHREVSLAKVQRGLARLRQATEMTRNHSQSLAVAKDVLGTIRSESAFPDAKPELKGMLETIAKGLSEQARTASDPKLVAETREAVKLIEDNVFTSKRNKALMDDIAASLQITERNIARSDELTKAIAAMDEMTAKGESERAFAVRRMLLKSYPDLIDNAQLSAAVLKVTEAQQSAVQFVAQPKPADPPQAIVEKASAVAIARRNQLRSVASAQGDVVYALAEGAAYGLDAATGQVLWRRFVGYADDGSSLRFAPMPINDQPGCDVLVVDSQAQAVVRIEATTGRVRWQQSIGEPFHARPVLDKNNHAIVATSSGRLVMIDLATGDSPGFIQIPQPLSTAPTLEARTDQIFVVAEHSNLYVLSSEGKCEKVIYLAHEPAAVVASPVVVTRLLVIVENRGFRNAVLRVFSLEPNGETPALTEVQQIDIEGHIDASPLVTGTRMLATTDSGRVVAYRVSGTDAEKPLEEVAQLQTSDDPNLIRFPLLTRDKFFVADKALTRYELLASMGNFRTEWTSFSNSVFLQPLTDIGQNLFFVRRQIKLPGVQVAAVSMDKPEMLWETNLAVPLVGEPIITPAGDVEVVTALGSLLEISADKLNTRTTVDQALVSLRTDEIRQAVADVARTPEGAVVLSMGPGSDQLAVFDPSLSPKQFRPVVLKSPLGASPVAMAGGILIPCQEGQAFLFDPRSGGQLAEPFQTKLIAGEKTAWCRPAVIDRDSVVLTDGRDHIYRLVVKDKPTRQVAAAAEATINSPITSPLAVVGDMVFAVNQSDQLLRLQLPNLSAAEPLALGARATWGPERAGNSLFLTTENDDLVCVDSKGQLAWQVPLLHGVLAGVPLPIDNDYLIASRSGVLSRIEGATGKEIAAIETGTPLGAGPTLVGQSVLLVGADGTLYLSEQPSPRE